MDAVQPRQQGEGRGADGVGGPVGAHQRPVLLGPAVGERLEHRAGQGAESASGSVAEVEQQQDALDLDGQRRTIGATRRAGHHRPPGQLAMQAPLDRLEPGHRPVVEQQRSELEHGLVDPGGELVGTDVDDAHGFVLPPAQHVQRRTVRGRVRHGVREPPPCRRGVRGVLNEGARHRAPPPAARGRPGRWWRTPPGSAAGWDATGRCTAGPRPTGPRRSPPHRRPGPVATRG